MPIEHLAINNGEIKNEAIAIISNMETITEIRIQCGNLTSENLVQLAEGLPELEAMSFENIPDFTIDGVNKMLPHARKLSRLQLLAYAITINEEDYDKILRSVKRPQKVKLLIKFFRKFVIGVTEERLKVNRGIFYIEKFN